MPARRARSHLAGHTWVRRTGGSLGVVKKRNYFGRDGQRLSAGFYLTKDRPPPDPS